MTYLVTGGTGFIGSRVVRDLVKGGEDVAVYDWAPNEASLAAVLSHQEIKDRVNLVRGDVTDLPRLLQSVKDHGISRIIHLASLMYQDVNADPARGIRINCEGTANVFEAARQAGIEKVVWESSATVFGPPDKYAEEYIPNDAAHYPTNLYGAAKSLDERVAAYYRDRYGLDITALRLVMVYGPGMRRGRTARIIQELVYNPALGQPGKVPAAADNLFGWTYCDDAAAVTVAASRSARTPEAAYSVAGELATIGEMADIVRGLVPGAEISLLPAEKAGGASIMTCKFDTAAFDRDIGFKARWTLKDGLKATMNAARAEAGPPKPG